MSSPSKPYPEYPLYRHKTGQWAKKIRGRTYYFGTDVNAALTLYKAQVDDLQAGRVPRVALGGATVRAVCNAFLTAKARLVEADELSPRTWRDYHDSCATLVDTFADKAVLDLSPDEFDRLRSDLAKVRGPVALGNEIQRIRTILKYAFDASLIDRPVRFGPYFRRPSLKTVKAAHRAARQARTFDAETIREVLELAKGQMRAMILLGINCGFGQTDVARLPREAVDLEAGVVDFPRPKNSNERRCTLWPETVAALRAVYGKRPAPKDPADRGLVFITKYGHRWVHVKERPDGAGVCNVDSVGLQFTKLLVAVGRKGQGNFYNLRRTFANAAERSIDFAAVKFIMGHTDPAVIRHYRAEIPDDRLRVVTDLVRAWLWPKAKGRKRR